MIKKELDDLKSTITRLKEAEDLLQIDINNLKGKILDGQEELHRKDERIFDILQNEKVILQKHKTELDSLNLHYEKLLNDFKDEKEKLEEEHYLCRARLHGLREEHGLITPEDDFSSKESELKQVRLLLFFNNRFLNLSSS